MSARQPLCRFHEQVGKIAAGPGGVGQRFAGRPHAWLHVAMPAQKGIGLNQRSCRLNFQVVPAPWTQPSGMATQLNGLRVHIGIMGKIPWRFMGARSSCRRDQMGIRRVHEPAGTAGIGRPLEPRAMGWMPAGMDRERPLFPFAMLSAPPSLGVALRLGLLLISLACTPVWSQYSPNCLLNGSRRFCALTPGRQAPPGWTVETVVFADHQAFRLERQESSCQEQGLVRTCPARIVAANGLGTPIPAVYVGTAYEGGYRHHYSGRSGRLSLTFFFLD
jgi:hypothetical protein